MSDADYGRSAEAAIRVGGLAGSNIRSGPRSERAYLDRLRGPEGQRLTYERLGSCCTFPTENSPLGSGRLDIYEVRYEGIDEPVQLYLNMYDPADATLRAPAGFVLAE